MKKNIILFIFFISTICVVHDVAASSSLNVSTSGVDGYVYRLVDKLVAARLVGNVIYGQKPYSRSEMARIAGVAKANLDALEVKYGEMSHELPEYGRYLNLRSYILPIINELQEKYREESIALGFVEGKTSSIELHVVEKINFDFQFMDSPWRRVPRTNGRGVVEAELNPFVDFTGGRKYVDGFSNSAEWTTWARFSKFVVLNLTPRVDVLILDDGNSEGGATLQSVYGKFSISNFELEVGRDEIVWGQGEHGGILISDNARSIDMVKISNDHPFRLPSFLKYIGDIKTTFFAGVFGSDWNGENHPIFTGLKFSFKPASFLELGVSQALIMKDDISFKDGVLEFFGYRPGIGITPSDIVLGAPNLTNRLTGVDMRITIPQMRCTQVYYEMFTEACCGVFEWLWGYYGGVYVPRLSNSGNLDLRIEYRHFPPVFYRNGTLTAGWTLDDRILGDPLGPQADGVYLSSNYDINVNNTLRFQFAYEHYSADRIGGTTENPVVTESKPKEDRYRTTIRYRRKQNNYITFIVTTGYERVKQFNFIRNNDRNNFLFQTILSLNLDDFLTYRNRSQ